MYSTLLMRSQRRSVLNSLFFRQERKIHSASNQTYKNARLNHNYSIVKNHLMNNNLLHILKQRINGFSFKVFAVPFAGSLALIGINARGSEKQEENHRKLFDAVKNRDQIILKSLINKGVDLNRRHQLGWTALHAAAVNKELKIVEFLLKHHADPNLEDDFSCYWDVSEEKKLKHSEVQSTREKEFNGGLNKKSNFKGYTALHYAVLSDDAAIIEVLLDAGADPTKENKNGHKPKAYAKNNKIAETLQQAEKKFADLKEAIEEKEKRYFPLEQRLKQVIIGQEAAISTVAEAVRSTETGWVDEDTPLVFLFLGSSGIGKTKLAKEVGAYLHKDSKKGFIRIDMSEYQQQHEVAKFIGSPPGYHGHEHGGQLTEKLTNNPKAVVLFDEIEKAHPDILTILLQLFDEGRLTDGKGNTIQCKDAIFIMTTNLASDVLAEHAIELRKETSSMIEQKRHFWDQRCRRAMQFAPFHSNFVDEVTDLQGTERIKISEKFKKETVKPILKNHFKRDEFLGRITDYVYFLPFTRSEITSLVEKELLMWAKKAEKKHKMKLLWDYNVKDVLANSYDVHYGARSIKNVIRNKVVSKLSTAHAKGLLKEYSVIKICASQATDYPHWTELDEDKDVPSISLQLYNKNNMFEDIDLKIDDNPFDI